MTRERQMESVLRFIEPDYKQTLDAFKLVRRVHGLTPEQQTAMERCENIVERIRLALEGRAKD